jgi:hypothetical protein
MPERPRQVVGKGRPKHAYADDQPYCNLAIEVGIKILIFMLA